MDAAWDFDFRDEVRRLATNRVVTAYGETARSERARALISGRKGWEDLAQRVAYVTSHDVEQFTEQRLYGMFMDLLAPSWQSRPASDLDLAALDEAVAAMRTVFAHPDAAVVRQAEAYIASYLRRKAADRREA